jgi:small subunit ribosomal protein S15
MSIFAAAKSRWPGMALKNKSLTSNFFQKMAEYLAPEKKQELFAKYGKSNTDTGSPESQVALFSYRIAHLTEHLKSNKHDYSTRRSLLKLVGKRRRVLDYLKSVDIERYRAIVKELGLRR